MSATFKACVALVMLVSFCHEFTAEPKRASKLGKPSDKWTALILTFLKFTPMPITSEQASLAGWIKDADHNDRARYFAGDRFKSKDDITTRLIFDCDGRIAGLQATISTSATYPTKHNSPPWKLTDDGAQATITAYLRDPEKICPKNIKRLCKDRLSQKPPIGDRLWIQYNDVRNKGPDTKVMEIPLNTKHLAGTQWVEGNCVPYMGVHYHYNISVGMDCDYGIPVFLIVNKQTGDLHGFGWGVPVDVVSNRWEHPTVDLFARSIKPKDMPKCLKTFKRVSVQHVYFVNPETISCN